MKISGKNELIYEDIKKVIENAALFSIPLLIAFLTGLQQGLVPVDSWRLFVVPALINALIDLSKKYLGVHRYQA